MGESLLCGACGDRVEYLDPFGDGSGWWAHQTHPDDEHAVTLDSDSESTDVPYIRTWAEPPKGWFWVGTAQNIHEANMEYSTALGEDGLPLFERPIPGDDDDE